MDPKKSELIRFLATPEFRSQLEVASKNLGLPMSELIRTSVDTYLDTRIEAAQNRYISRATKYMTKDDAVEQVNALMDGMSLQGYESWGDPAVTPDKLFSEFVKMKIATAGRELVPA